MELQHNNRSLNNENLVSKYWTKYFPYWPVFILFMALAISGAWVYLQFKIPVYESTATLLVKDEKKGEEDSKMMESLNMLSTKKIIENEIEVIKSRKLMAQVVNKLDLYAPVFEKNKWKDVSAYSNSPVKIELQNPDSLIEIKHIDFSFDSAKKLIKIQDATYALNQWQVTPYGVLFFSLNNGKQTNTQFYFSLIDPKRVVNDLIKRLDVLSANKLSSVIDLKLDDEVPQRSEDVLNNLIAFYNQAAVDDKSTLAKNTLSFLDARLGLVSNNLDSIEKQLELYKSNKGAIDISSQANLFLQDVSDNDQKIAETSAKIEVLKQLEEYISSNDKKNELKLSTFKTDDPVLLGLLTKLDDLESEYGKSSVTMGENNPSLQSVETQINDIKPAILDNLKNQEGSLEIIKNNLSSTNNGYNSLLQGLPQEERNMVEISREQNIKTSIYSFLLQKREDLALSGSYIGADSRVVDYAQSSLDPVGPGSKIIYAIAVFLGILLCMAIITLREVFNSTILYRKEIEMLTSFPVIGEVLLDTTQSPVVIKKGKPNFIFEQFRMLRTSLSYLGIGSGEKKIILVTSSIPGEGKSFIASNLAISLAMTGKKVLLVDFDLTHPTQSYIFNIAAENGIIDYLNGDSELHDIIKKDEHQPGLYIITAGTPAINSEEIISSENTKGFIEKLSAIFDFVIIDCAPVGIVSDGYILTRYCDATLYVVKHGHTPKKMLAHLEQNNKINELKNIALVFNGIKLRGFGKNRYEYGYGYINNRYQRKVLKLKSFKSQYINSNN